MSTDSPTQQASWPYFIAAWAVAAPMALWSDGVGGLRAVPVAALSVLSVSLASRLLIKQIAGDHASPAYRMMIGTAARTTLLFSLMMLAFDALDLNLFGEGRLFGAVFDAATARLAGCCMLPFYFALLAGEIRSAQLALSRATATPPLAG